MATRGIQAVAALVSILLVARYLDRATQGYYYTFLGFAVFVQLSEFGLAYAVMQSASHESPTERSPVADLSADHVLTSRLSALLRGAFRFNSTTTVLSAIVVALIGTRILDTGKPAGVGAQVDWGGPWSAAILAVAISQLLNPQIALLEGVGYVEAVWLLRLKQEVAAACALWAGLVFGFGLWSIAVSYVVRLAVGLTWVQSGWRRPYFARLKQKDAVAHGAYWWGEVWPFQWRIGVSAVSGYLIFQFFTPLMFALKGAEIAGQFGMTLSLTNGLLTATSAWLASQAPLFGRLIAQGSFHDLDLRFKRSLLSSFAVVLGAGAILEGGVILLNRIHHPFAARMLPPTAFALFVGAAVTNHVIFAMAVYLRAHRREPLMAASVCGALLTPLTIYIAGRHFGTTAIAGCYLALTLLGLVITTAVFFSCARGWRTQSYA